MDGFFGIGEEKQKRFRNETNVHHFLLNGGPKPKKKITERLFMEY
jgi:hypothetical protein